MDIGIVERETNRLKLFPVDKRDPETLTAINKDNVVPGTTVVTDGWATYKGLSEQGYKHYIVEHKRSFSQSNRGRVEARQRLFQAHERD